MTNTTQPQLLTVAQVATFLGVSKTTIYRWLQERPEFPKPVKLGDSSTRWRRSDLEAFVASLPEVAAS